MDKFMTWNVIFSKDVTYMRRKKENIFKCVWIFLKRGVGIVFKTLPKKKIKIKENFKYNSYTKEMAMTMEAI